MSSLWIRSQAQLLFSLFSAQNIPSIDTLAGAPSFLETRCFGRSFTQSSRSGAPDGNMRQWQGAFFA